MPQDPSGVAETADSTADPAPGQVPTAEPQPAPPRPVPGRGPSGDTRITRGVLAPSREPERGIVEPGEQRPPALRETAAPPAPTAERPSKSVDQAAAEGRVRSGDEAGPVVLPPEGRVPSRDDIPFETAAGRTPIAERPGSPGPPSQRFSWPAERPLGPQPYPSIAADDGSAAPSNSQPGSGPITRSHAGPVVEPTARPVVVEPSPSVVPEERPAWPESPPPMTPETRWDREETRQDAQAPFPHAAVRPAEQSPAGDRSRRTARSRVRIRARRVQRIIRRIDLWSVLKLSLMLYTCLYVATLAALAVVWGIAYSTGMVEKLQGLLGDVGLDNFRFYGDQMFRACAAMGAVLVLAGTLITVLAVALINLISELTGGIRVIVIEEEPWAGDQTG